MNVTPVAPAPSRAPPGQIHSGNQDKCCAPLRPNACFFLDARPRRPASDYKCGDKSNLFGKVPSRARETLTFEALQNSKHGDCHLASTKHLLLNMLEFRFAELRGICSFQICQINVTNVVSQLSCSSRFRYLGLAWLGLLGSAWVGMVSLGFKQDPQRITTGVKPGISHQRQKGPFVEPCHTTLTAHPHIS